jgi:hypothetical protein
MSFAVIGLPLSWGAAWLIKREPVNAPRCSSRTERDSDSESYRRDRLSALAGGGTFGSGVGSGAIRRLHPPPRSLRNRLLLAAASHAAKPPEACPRPPLRSLPPR